MTPRTAVIRKIRVEARRNASRLLPASSCSVKTGHERALQSGVGEQAADQVRDLEGDRERRHRRADAEVARGDDLADQADDARGAGRDAEEAVERPIRRSCSVGSVPSAEPANSSSIGSTRRRDGSAAPAAAAAAAPSVSVDSPINRYSVRPLMANIASQKKRILRTERERDENRRFTGAVKTQFRRLEEAVAIGRRRQGRRGRAPDADLADRQGRPEGRPARQHRRPQEGPRRADRLRLLAAPPIPITRTPSRRPLA